MSPPVFDSGPWDLPGGADHLVSHFDYLNSSDREETARVRSAVEDMFSRYPAEAQDALRARLRSIENNTHLAAFFELALHELLLRSGCRILAVEPDLDATERSPDFLAETSSRERFYLEATLATGRSQADEGADRRLREAFQAIDAIHSPDFFLDLHYSGTPSAPVSGRTLRRRLEGWLRTLDYDAVVVALTGEPDARPSFRYEQNGLRLRIYPIPRRRSRGLSQVDRAIAGRTLSPLSIQPEEPIRTAVLGKAGRYGDLGAPYVIAVNALSDYADEDSALDALFGSYGVSVRPTDDGFEEREGRDTDGAWRGPGGPVNTRVTAVLSTEGLTPWSLGQRRARLIMNPWARYTLANPLPDIDLIEVREERLIPTQAWSLAELFELPPGWPE